MYYVSAVAKLFILSKGVVRMLSTTGEIENSPFRRRPFHESVVEVIRMASNNEIPCIAILIKLTRIDRDHVAIIKAWGEKLSELGAHEDFGVTNDLLEQKRIAEIMEMT